MKLGILIAGFAIALNSSLALADGKYDIDPVHSAVNFKAKHLDTSFTWGRFKGVSGHFNLDEKNPSASSVSIKVDASSVETFDAKRDEHLRGPDFLNTKEFKEITFESKKVEKVGDKFKITGTLNFNGQKKEVTVEATKIGSIAKDPWGFTRTGFEAEFEITTSDFKVKGVEGVGPKIKLIIGLEGMRKA